MRIPFIHTTWLRVLALFAVYHLLVERIFYSSTGMIFEHQSFTGWLTLWQWHFIPYSIVALIMVAQTEIIYRFLQKEGV